VDRDLRGNTWPGAARMEGVPRDVAWWDATVLPAPVGGYVLTGAERKVPDEPVRGLYDYDVVKSKLYYVYVGIPMHTYLCVRRVKPIQTQCPPSRLFVAHDLTVV
jgi:hypothetical protein